MILRNTTHKLIETQIDVLKIRLFNSLITHTHTHTHTHSLSLSLSATLLPLHVANIPRRPPHHLATALSQSTPPRFMPSYSSQLGIDRCVGGRMKLLVMGCVGGYCGCNGSFLVVAVGFFFFFFFVVVGWILWVTIAEFYGLQWLWVWQLMGLIFIVDLILQKHQQEYAHHTYNQYFFIYNLSKETQKY